MRAIVRRVGRLEGRLTPKGNAASSRVAGLLQDRRRRRLEASGQPFEDSSRDNMPPGPRGCLSVAETLRLRRRQRLDRRVEHADHMEHARAG
jgi:hypothetical protein